MPEKNPIILSNMTEEIIDIEAQEVIEPQTPFLNVKVKEKEMKKIMKQYNRYRKSIFAEIARIDGAPQYDNPFSS